MIIALSDTDRTLSILGKINQMIDGRNPLPEILHAIANTAQELTRARWCLFVDLPPAQPAEYYGPDEAIALGPLLLRDLDRALVGPSPSLPLTLTIAAPFSDAVPLHTRAMPIFQERALRGSLAAFYDNHPKVSPDLILSYLGSQASIAINNRRLYTIAYQRYEYTIQALASAIDARDPTTHRHSQYVTLYSTTLAQALGLSEQEVNVLRHAAILHDIGKIGIPEDILSKPGPLTPEERAVVESHPLVGVAILYSIPDLHDLIPLIRHHHERYNGSGYPDGLRGEEIPLGARILAIADSFDAMTQERPYHRMLSIDEACEILQNEAGALYDPELVRAFIRIIHRI